MGNTNSGVKWNISGPVSVLYLESKKFDKRLLIFGDWHNSNENLCTSKFFKKSNNIKIADFFYNTVIKNNDNKTPKCIDFIIEVGRKYYNEIKPGKNKLPTACFESFISSPMDYLNCYLIKNLTTGIYSKNVRIHWMGTRRNEIYIYNFYKQLFKKIKKDEEKWFLDFNNNPEQIHLYNNPLNIFSSFCVYKDMTYNSYFELTVFYQKLFSKVDSYNKYVELMKKHILDSIENYNIVYSKYDRTLKDVNPLAKEFFRIKYPINKEKKIIINFKTLKNYYVNLLDNFFKIYESWQDLLFTESSKNIISELLNGIKINNTTHSTTINIKIYIKNFIKFYKNDNGATNLGSFFTSLCSLFINNGFILTDLYMITRILKPVQKGKSMDNIIMYMGNNHVLNYKYFFNKLLNFKIYKDEILIIPKKNNKYNQPSRCKNLNIINDKKIIGFNDNGPFLIVKGGNNKIKRSKSPTKKKRKRSKSPIKKKRKRLSKKK